MNDLISGDSDIFPLTEPVSLSFAGRLRAAIFVHVSFCAQCP